MREYETGGIRPLRRYIEHFAQIRRIQKYILARALEHDVTVIDNVRHRRAVKAVMTEILAGRERVAAAGVAGEIPVAGGRRMIVPPGSARGPRRLVLKPGRRLPILDGIPTARYVVSAAPAQRVAICAKVPHTSETERRTDSVIWSHTTAATCVSSTPFASSPTMRDREVGP